MLKFISASSWKNYGKQEIQLQIFFIVLNQSGRKRSLTGNRNARKRIKLCIESESDNDDVNDGISFKYIL